MSSYSRRYTVRTPTRRRRVSRMAPSRRGGTAKDKNDVNPTEDPDGRLLLSNVGPDVNPKLFNEVFEEFGKVLKVVIHCNTDKYPIGTAEVWMISSSVATKAKNKLNATDIFSDGRIIRIEKPKLLTRPSKFWKNVFQYISKVYSVISK